MSSKLHMGHGRDNYFAQVTSGAFHGLNDCEKINEIGQRWENLC